MAKRVIYDVDGVVHTPNTTYIEADCTATLTTYPCSGTYRIKVFDDVVVDRKDNYNSVTGVGTLERAGVYGFWVDLVTYDVAMGVNDSFSVALFVNGVVAQKCVQEFVGDFEVRQRITLNTIENIAAGATFSIRHFLARGAGGTYAFDHSDKYCRLRVVKVA